MQESASTPYATWLNPGEMARRVAVLDWTMSPLGPLTQWPAELRVAATLCFESPLPSCVYWGREAIEIFNLPYAETILGDPSARSLGRPLPTAAPGLPELHQKLERVFLEGQTIGPHQTIGNGSSHANRLAGSFSPIRNAAGDVVGIYQAVGGTGAQLTPHPPPPPTDLTHKPSDDRELGFTAFVDAIPTLAWMADSDGYIYWYNQRWYVYTGTTPRQMEGWGWQTVHDPSMLPSVMERWITSIKTGRPFEMVFPLRGADGIFRSFLTRISPIRSEAGVVTHWVGTNTEIDELERTRDALAASEQELRYMVDLSPQMPWIATPDGNFIHMARRWLEMTGMPLDEPVGTRWQQVQHTDDILAMEKAWFGSLSTGVPLDIEHRIRSVSGTYRWFRSRAYPRRDPAGNIVKWYGTTEDIDDQKQAQAALARSEERLRLALSAVSVLGTFDWNIKDDHLELDAVVSRLFGIEPHRGLAGVRIDDWVRILHPEDSSRVQALVARTMETGQEYAADYCVIRPDDTIRWLSARGTCLFDNEHRPARFVGVILDVTERKLTEHALVQNEKLAAVGRLAASIAHEINNPLESAINLIYLAREGTDPVEIRHYLEVAEQELRHVSTISGQTLRLHRQSNNTTLVNFEGLSAGVLSMFNGRLRSLHITVEQRFRGGGVNCFEGEIRQVVSNLIGNAIDAMSPGPGRLLLRSRSGVNWRTGAKGLVVTVADSGPGMSLTTVRRALEPFFTTKDVAGTGLGLWICKEIVDRHQGTLRFRSSQSAQQHGTVFNIFLPCEPPKPFRADSMLV